MAANNFVIFGSVPFEMPTPEVDPGFFPGGGAPLRNDVTDR